MKQIQQIRLWRSFENWNVVCTQRIVHLQVILVVVIAVIVVVIVIFIVFVIVFTVEIVFIFFFVVFNFYFIVTHFACALNIDAIVGVRGCFLLLTDIRFSTENCKFNKLETQ